MFEFELEVVSMKKKFAENELVEADLTSVPAWPLSHNVKGLDTIHTVLFGIFDKMTFGLKEAAFTQDEWRRKSVFKFDVDDGNNLIWYIGLAYTLRNDISSVYEMPYSKLANLDWQTSAYDRFFKTMRCAVMEKAYETNTHECYCYYIMPDGTQTGGIVKDLKRAKSLDEVLSDWISKTQK